MTGGDTPSEGCIVPLAKTCGITSFAAIDSVKKAYIPSYYMEDSFKKGDEGGKAAARKKAARLKVGHTGTLDSFADGLLVVLTNKLTRLAPFIEALPKEYLAEIAFGSQTDTLDPTGAIVREAGLPAAAALLAAIPCFAGKIQQAPPEYSALKQDGKRLSDLARAGEDVIVKAREIVVYRIDVISLASPEGGEAFPAEFPASGLVARAVIRARCSKGTYVRALARDIAEAAGSAAHLSALRRLSVGPFALEKAAGFSALKPFPPPRADTSLLKPPAEEILAKSIRFAPDVASSCGLAPLSLKEEALAGFRCGRTPSPKWFEAAPALANASVFAVFSCGRFAGVIHKEGAALAYDFVL